MSHKCSLWAWDLSIPPREKLVLLALADWSNDDGFCYPGQQTIALRCSMGDRAVRECLTSLKAKGLVSVISRGKPRGGRASNVYALAVPGRERAENDAETNAAATAGLGAGALPLSEPEACG